MTPGELEGRGPDPSRSKAIVAMLLAGVFFAVMGISTRATSSIDVVITKIPAIEVTFFRFLIGVLVLLPLQGKNGIQLLGNNRKRLVYRGIIGGFAVLCYFLSLQQTSLIHAQLLNYGSIVFAPIFASIFLKEKLGIRTVTAVLTAATGMFLILHATNTQGQTIIGDLYGLLSGILAGAAITEIRLLRQSESSWSIFFYFGATWIFAV